MGQTPTERKIICPNCKKETVFSLENKFRPFCSERCRLIDLGQWASESYRVPVQEKTPDLEKNSTDGENHNDSDAH